MYKILIVVITLASFVPLNVLADGKLQALYDMVKNMDKTRLCDRECVPEVAVDGTDLTISFSTKITDGVDTNTLCECMKNYMKQAVGDASSNCKVKENNELAIVFRGEYNPHTKPLTPLTSLSNILSNYEEPDLGGYKCTKVISEKDGKIYIELTYIGITYRNACAGIIHYLNQNKFLDGSSNKCTKTDETKKAVLNLWSE